MQKSLKLFLLTNYIPVWDLFKKYQTISVTNSTQANHSSKVWLYTDTSMQSCMHNLEKFQADLIWFKPICQAIFFLQCIYHSHIDTQSHIQTETFYGLSEGRYFISPANQNYFKKLSKSSDWLEKSWLSKKGTSLLDMEQGKIELVDFWFNKLSHCYDRRHRIQVLLENFLILELKQSERTFALET